jgi:hypothetical protein
LGWFRVIVMMRDVGYGMRDAGFEIPDTGYAIWDTSQIMDDLIPMSRQDGGFESGI